MERIAEPDDLMLRFGKAVPSLTLASSSPNRKALLERCGCRVRTYAPDADETRSGRNPEEIVTSIAGRKLAAYLSSAAYERESIAIAADTLVLINGMLLGKPKDEEDARKMLRSLSGKEQVVLSAAGIKMPNREPYIILDKASVIFRPLSDDDINTYIATGESIGAAGAYRLQKTGYTLIDRIIGDWTTVVGLPLAAILDSICQGGNHE